MTATSERLTDYQRRRDEQVAEWHRRAQAGETLTQQVHRKLINDGLMNGTVKSREEEHEASE